MVLLSLRFCGQIPTPACLPLTTNKSRVRLLELPSGSPAKRPIAPMGSISRPRTLVTGANGFVGATVVSEALKAGHHVTGSVRSKKSGDELVAIHPEWDSSMIDFVEVADYTADGVFDEIFRQGNYDYVIHVAAPMPDNPEYTDFVTHFEKPSIEGNRQILMSAMRYGNKVKAVSVVGSINAITNGDPTDLKSRVMTDKEWLQVSCYQRRDTPAVHAFADTHLLAAHQR